MKQKVSLREHARLRGVRLNTDPNDRIDIEGNNRKCFMNTEQATQYTTTYNSPLGELLLAGDEAGLTGLWFAKQKFYARNLNPQHQSGKLPVFEDARRWLDIYFDGKEPDFIPALHLVGSPFQIEVWKILQTIPYGQTTTYGQIARTLAVQTGLAHMSAQAVGGAVGHNEISIIIPCHRVVGTNGNLTGYAGGLDKKIRLLKLEKADMSNLFRPKKGTAL